MTSRAFDDFTSGYLDAAGFTEDDPRHTSGEYCLEIDDLNPAFIVDAIRDCAEFQSRAEDWIDEDRHTPGSSADSAGNHAGRDFWYTRQGHGCGFWDGDWTKDVAEKLTDLAKSFGEYYTHSVFVEPEDKDGTDGTGDTAA